VCKTYPFNIYNECNEAGLFVALKCDSVFPFSRRASVAEKEKKFYYGVPSTCGAQWEGFAFEAHVDQQDIHISECRDSRKGSTE
jgi:hypothetical protein